jgi:hypothetical protein
MSKTDVQKNLAALPIPSGGSPLGTGQWPVPPSGAAAATSEFRLKSRIPSCSNNLTGKPGFISILR